jgi:S-adenosyl methyltransferase
MTGDQGGEFRMAGQWLRRQAWAQDRAGARAGARHPQSARAGAWHPQSARVDARHPQSARVYDYWLGGKDNFAADRDAAHEAATANPGIVADAEANRAFLGRAVHHLASRCGIGQFLDIGAGLPAAGNTHEVAQAVIPAARVVYADSDPAVLTHARARLVSGPAGHCDYLDAELRDPVAILRAAAHTLDLTRPVAVLLLLVLHLIPDAEDPHEIVASLLDGVPGGSYLVLSHPASDVRPAEVAEMTRRINQRLMGTKATVRDRAQVSRFFTGLGLAEPGVVQPQQWRPEPGQEAPPEVAIWCGVARKS